jgi:hypothetical protein
MTQLNKKKMKKYTHKKYNIKICSQILKCMTLSVAFFFKNKKKIKTYIYIYTYIRFKIHN